MVPAIIVLDCLNQRPSWPWQDNPSSRYCPTRWVQRGRDERQVSHSTLVVILIIRIVLRYFIFIHSEFIVISIIWLWICILRSSRLTLRTSNAGIPALRKLPCGVGSRYTGFAQTPLWRRKPVYRRHGMSRRHDARRRSPVYRLCFLMRTGTWMPES